MQRFRRCPERSSRGLIGAILLLAGCVNVHVEEVKTAPSVSSITADATVVVLTRRYQADPDFANCIGDKLADDHFTLYPRQVFKDLLFPWFESRIAPRSIDDLRGLLADPVAAERLRKTDIWYLVWIDGVTETARPNVFWPVGLSWETASNYEASVWSLRPASPLGKVSVRANGTSYVLMVMVFPAVLPFIARVEAAACDQLATRLRDLLRSPGAVVHPAQ